MHGFGIHDRPWYEGLEQPVRTSPDGLDQVRLLHARRFGRGQLDARTRCRRSEGQNGDQSDTKHEHEARAAVPRRG